MSIIRQKLSLIWLVYSKFHQINLEVWSGLMFTKSDPTNLIRHQIFPCSTVRFVEFDKSRQIKLIL